MTQTERAVHTVKAVMKFFIDTADVHAIAPLIKTGVFYGVTTNPTILKTAGIKARSFHDFARNQIRCGAQEVFFQSWGENADELTTCGRFLFNDEPQIVVKLPCTREGLGAASRLSQDGIKTCITAVYAAHQALLASAVGAAYVAPYLGRMNDAGRDGHALIAQMANALRQGHSQTKILAASIRTVEDVMTLAQNGVDCVTVNPTIANLLFEEALTQEAVVRFDADACSCER